MATKQVFHGVMAAFAMVFAAEPTMAAEANAAANVTVAWAPTDTLSEVKQNQTRRGWLRPEDWKKELAAELNKRAQSKLSPGQSLEVTIDDIKLAGDYEPWHGPDAQDIRFMKDIYPPRIDLHYKLVDADGRTIRERESKLRDLSYLQRVVPTDTDPLRYDKRLIDDWIRREFRDDKA